MLGHGTIFINVPESLQVRNQTLRYRSTTKSIKHVFFFFFTEKLKSHRIRLCAKKTVLQSFLNWIALKPLYTSCHIALTSGICVCRELKLSQMHCIGVYSLS